MLTTPSVDKYNRRVVDVDSLVCVGLDSDLIKLPLKFRSLDHPQFAFNHHIIEQTAPFVSAYKFNVSFYASSSGWEQLAKTLEFLRQHYPDILTICDAKYGDIASSSEAYASEIFNRLGFDAITLNPYLGRDALQPFLNHYMRKACIILCLTSNLGSRELQDIPLNEGYLWKYVAERVIHEWNSNNNCMLVVAANRPNEMAEIRRLVGNMTILVPGIGTQGGSVESVVTNGQNRHGSGLIINSSREIIFNDNPAQAARTLYEHINHVKRYSNI